VKEFGTAGSLAAKYYSRDLLTAPEARRTWVVPDLGKLHDYCVDIDKQPTEV